MPIIETYILFGEDAFINNIRHANLIFTKIIHLIILIKGKMKLFGGYGIQNDL